MTDKIKVTHVILRDATLLHVVGDRLSVRDRIVNASASYPWVDLGVVGSTDVQTITVNVNNVYVIGSDHDMDKPSGKPGAPNEPAAEMGGGLEVNIG